MQCRDDHCGVVAHAAEEGPARTTLISEAEEGKAGWFDMGCLSNGTDAIGRRNVLIRRNTLPVSHLSNAGTRG